MFVCAKYLGVLLITQKPMVLFTKLLLGPRGNMCKILFLHVRAIVYCKLMVK